MALPCADKGGGLHQPQDHVHFVQRVLRRVHHIIAQFVLRLVDAGRVHEHNLPLVGGQHCPDPVAGSLGLAGGDRYLLPDQMVHQRGFPYIRPADQGDKA